MSTTAPWIAIAIDWMDSDMFDDATPAARLAWVCLLCHAKSSGRGGRVVVRKNAFLRRYQLSERALTDMLAAAQKCGAITVEGETVTVCNWRAYQDPRARFKPVDPERFTETSGTTRNDATLNPSPLTPHQPPITEESARPSSSDRYSVRSLTDAIWQAIPTNRRQARSRLDEALAEELRDRFGADWPVNGKAEAFVTATVIPQVVAYYGSALGRSRRSRQPATLIRDRIWETESPESWKDPEQQEPKKWTI